MIDLPEDVRRKLARQLKWDRIWLGMAQYVGQACSKDPSTKVGSVLTRDVNKFVSFGYNGPPEGMSDDPVIYLDREVKLSRTVHAEINACLTARGEGPFTLYCSLHPCDRCVGPMRNRGVTRAVFPKPSEAEWRRWESALLSAQNQMEECGIDWLYLNA